MSIAFCPMCPGHGMFLGNLGSSAKFRCRDCGWDWSEDATPDGDTNEDGEACCVVCGTGLGYGSGLDSEACSDCSREHENDA